MNFVLFIKNCGSLSYTVSVECADVETVTVECAAGVAWIHKHRVRGYQVE